MKSNMRWLFLILLIVAFIEPALAARTIGEIGQTVGEQGTGVAFGVKMVAFVIGLVLFVGAIVIFATLKKTQTPISIPIIMAIAGICLMSLTAFISVGSTSLFGNDEASNALNDLGVK